MNKNIKVGLIGYGTVGTGVAKLLFNSQKCRLRGSEYSLDLVKIADLDVTTERGVSVPEGILTTDANDILNDPEIPIVIELIGGNEPARTYTLRAFESGKSVVTANKALIASYGDELLNAALKANVSYMFEASVGGGIPILRNILNGLNANNIDTIYGILNGTTNYILTGMTRDHLDYRKVLEKAQHHGYAESNPTSDVSGMDALNKIIILSRLAFGVTIHPDRVYREGIERITLQDIEYAGELGYTIKLLSIAKRHKDGRIEMRVHPVLVPRGSVLAFVDDEFNAIEIYGDAVGREIFYGKGAGMMPTASAVVSDVMDIASRGLSGSYCNISRIMRDEGIPDLMNIEELDLLYYLRFTIRDVPGVLARISSIFANENISIESVLQKGTAQGDYVPLIITTHKAREGNMQRAMKQFGKLDVVRGKVQLIRIEEV